ncbi:MAG: hypothetical protein WCW04_00570 [Candidatus Paceibacterota bacterium]
MKTKQLSLFELPKTLFNQFLSHLGVTEIKSFVLNYKNEKINCLYAALPRHGEYENPTIVFVDFRGTVAKTKVILLNQPPLIKNGEVESLRNYTSVFANYDGSQNGVFDIALNVNMPYMGQVTIGDPFTRFSLLYTLELSQRAEELFQSKKYEWIKQYKKDTALV